MREVAYEEEESSEMKSNSNNVRDGEILEKVGDDAMLFLCACEKCGAMAPWIYSTRYAILLCFGCDRALGENERVNGLQH